VKKYILVLLALIIVGLIMWNIRRENKPLVVHNDGPIVVFGDSLVFGYGSTEGHDFVSLLSSRIDRPIINTGVVRDTTESALTRLDRDVIARAPSLTLVLIGGNDVLRQIPKEQTLANVRSIINRLKASGSEVILVGVSNMVYAREYRAIAMETGAYYVPAVLDITFGNPDFMSDSVHPNDTGYALFADRIEPTLRESLGLDE
jgi:lysophospholipase L1-like esterase